tara:strand:+ start:194 stop:475 length:282 start_codon:yes stop_codon:yes gene_type:complete
MTPLKDKLTAILAEAMNSVAEAESLADSMIRCGEARCSQPANQVVASLIAQAHKIALGHQAVRTSIEWEKGVEKAREEAQEVREQREAYGAEV